MAAGGKAPAEKGGQSGGPARCRAGGALGLGRFRVSGLGGLGFRAWEV